MLKARADNSEFTSLHYQRIRLKRAERHFLPCKGLTRWENSLCLLLYQMSYSPNLGVALTKTLPLPPKGSTLKFHSTVLLRTQLPPTGSSHWRVCMLEYSIRHLTLGCDWIQPVQLCKWAPGGACWPGCGARTEVGAARSQGSDSERGRTGGTLDGLSLFKLYFPSLSTSFYNNTPRECQVKVRLGA